MARRVTLLSARRTVYLDDTMTAQAMHSVRFDDQDWAICEWNGSPPPSSESLGFSTQMESTGNYTGRVDHYVVEDVHDLWRGDGPRPAPRFQLRLARIDANLTPESRDFIPPPPFGAREDITRREWSEHITDIAAMLRGEKGPGVSKTVLDTRTRVALCFHNLWVPFTGTIVGGRAFNREKYVHRGTQSASSFGVRLHLTFANGVLAHHHIEKAVDVVSPNDLDDDTEEHH